MKREYDFRRGVRGKYAKRYQRGTNVVVLDPDVAAAYPDSASVNRVLRALKDVVQTSSARRKRRSA